MPEIGHAERLYERQVESARGDRPPNKKQETKLNLMREKNSLCLLNHREQKDRKRSVYILIRGLILVINNFYILYAFFCIFPLIIYRMCSRGYEQGLLINYKLASFPSVIIMRVGNLSEKDEFPTHRYFPSEISTFW